MLPKDHNPIEDKPEIDIETRNGISGNPEHQISLDELSQRYLGPTVQKAFAEINMNIEVVDARIEIDYKRLHVFFSVKRFSISILLLLSVITNIVTLIALLVKH